MDRRKPLTPPAPVPASRRSPGDRGAGDSVPLRRVSSMSAPVQVTPSNSNTRVTTGRPTAAGPVAPRAAPSARPANSNTRIATGRERDTIPAAGLRASENLGLNSERMRDALVQRLRAQGIEDEAVLAAIRKVPRHRFVDEALASRAYEDAALPIGHGQTISQPWIVARMIAAARQGRELGKVLEVGTGCGYQAAVLAGVAREVYSIERIRPLHDLARERLRPLRLHRVRLVFGDGMLGVPSAGPFDAIVVAAAGLQVPEALQQQLAVGARLVAPVGGTRQRLVIIERTSAQNWVRTELEPVRFVPLQSGVLL